MGNSDKKKNLAKEEKKSKKVTGKVNVFSNLKRGGGKIPIQQGICPDLIDAWVRPSSEKTNSESVGKVKLMQDGNQGRYLNEICSVLGGVGQEIGGSRRREQVAIVAALPPTSGGIGGEWDSLGGQIPEKQHG